MKLLGIDKAFVNIEKKIRQEAAKRMQQKMDRAAGKIVAKADSERGFDDVTGNLYKSIAVGTFYKGELMSIHHTPGPEPTRPTLAKGEMYNLPKYYRGLFDINMFSWKPYTGEYGSGGQNGEDAAEDTLLSLELDGGHSISTWRLVLVAGVDYANYVERVRGHDVISGLWQYMSRYFRAM